MRAVCGQPIEYKTRVQGSKETEMRKALIAQGGGPTAVINQSLAGIVIEARKLDVEYIYGARHGVRGIINEDFVDLSRVHIPTLEAVARTPGAALGSTRDKPDLQDCERICRVLQAHDIDYFFYIGGNDSADTLQIVYEEARRSNYDLVCIHVPKTIDNDLVGNDHTPGYGSAARFVVQAYMGLNLDNIALPGVHVAVIMGRNAGFLTAASALARKVPGDGPHLIYLPERRFSITSFLTRVDECMRTHDRCMVAVSEGIQDGSGLPISGVLQKSSERDAHGNLQLSGTVALSDLLCAEIKRQLGIKRVRGDTLGYIQRCFPNCVSDVDSREALRVGVMAVRYAIKHGKSGSVAIKRTKNYHVSYDLQPLEVVAQQTRTMDEEFVAESGNDVTDAFRDYLDPLLGSKLSQIYRLSAPAVRKILT